MKKICTITLFIAIFILNCGPEDLTELHVDIAVQPEGGEYVTELICIIIGCLYDEDEVTPITIEFQWWVSDTLQTIEEMVLADTYTFKKPEYEERDCSIFLEPGYYFLGYWWMEILWTDEDGTQHYLESNKAHCTGAQSENLPLSSPLNGQVKFSQ
ncbi:MAG: hypothetical protein WBB37_05255 [bacterium]